MNIRFLLLALFASIIQPIFEPIFAMKRSLEENSDINSGEQPKRQRTSCDSTGIFMPYTTTTSSSSENSLQECPVCEEETELIQLHGEHTPSCRSCLQILLADKYMQRGITPFNQTRCPESSCTELITRNELKIIINDEALLAQYLEIYDKQPEVIEALCEQDTKMLREINAKQCPQCKIFIQKNAGCIHVDCSYCGFKFCWICLHDYQISGCRADRCLNNSQTSLITAARSGDEVLVNDLLQQGFDPNLVDRHSMTPLHYAAQRGHIRIVQLLIALRDSDNRQIVDINQVNLNGYTARELALRNNHREIAELLPTSSSFRYYLLLHIISALAGASFTYFFI
ncbi:ankyrin repeat domain-containing protein [Candidatus Dependentiae bacterium]|jgi:hypothetical protein|nr:ankyrin repeat domain-containing protein [Candidatus Dependentiae bacterium]